MEKKPDVKIELDFTPVQAEFFKAMAKDSDMTPEEYLRFLLFADLERAGNALPAEHAAWLEAMRARRNKATKRAQTRDE